jgi:hypothetical protein
MDAPSSISVILCIPESTSHPWSPSIPNSTTWSRAWTYDSHGERLDQLFGEVTKASAGVAGRRGREDELPGGS